MAFLLKFAVPVLRFPLRDGNREPLKKRYPPFPVPVVPGTAGTAGTNTTMKDKERTQ